MTRTFTCAACGRQFESDATDEEAEREFTVTFPRHADHETAIVCDLCYDDFKAWYTDYLGERT